ncbi:UDP-glycosyltransferase UGT5-like isoform X2 [Topomyia yanbarensis]|uniref:UDP-glycosyltransferase UGT5-like isoform X2 n=1 Tax=Topomyia yanbarensis TaxID=2498891 RepID=UPI00273CD4EC|nr:UDP-glycosyltransferase UGT5-like isoform X2 [Topomyia yanbarensis]XP_058832650.1 UDP-glycosyltransferase UGT5-like isoform X2 [Topomyia yanbarensis]
MSVLHTYSLALFILSCLSWQSTESSRILGVFAFPGRSHWMMIDAILNELLDRGHQVTSISNYPLSREHENYTEIRIAPIYDFWKKSVKVDSLYDLTEISIHRMLVDFLYSLGLETAQYGFTRENVKNFTLNDHSKFDLILAEQFYQEAYLMFAHKYQAPIVTIGTFGFAQYMGPMMGMMNMWSHVPHEFLPYTDKMTLTQRTYNSMVSLYELLLRAVYYMPKQEAMARENFAHLEGPLPKIADLERQVSVILLNSHTPLTSTRAKVPGLVQVGGLHIKKPKTLPNDLRKFLDEAKDGAIYFSLGTNLRSADMPQDKLDSILNVFRSMKQRVVWKYEDESIRNLPSNVMIKSWLPQSDILAHRNVKVFITHGGLLGTQEGVHRAVPMLGIPIYCDQHLNMNKAVLGGYAVKLYFPNITETSFRWALDELLHKPEYKKNIDRISAVFRDRPIPALSEAAFWVEYVIRHKGAPQLRSAGLDLPWISFALLDVVGVILVAVLLTGWTIKKIANMCLGNGKHKLE